MSHRNYTARNRARIRVRAVRIRDNRTRRTHRAHLCVLNVSEQARDFFVYYTQIGNFRNAFARLRTAYVPFEYAIFAISAYCNEVLIFKRCAIGERISRSVTIVCILPINVVGRCTAREEVITLSARIISSVFAILICARRRILCAVNGHIDDFTCSFFKVVGAVGKFDVFALKRIANIDERLQTEQVNTVFDDEGAVFFTCNFALIRAVYVATVVDRTHTQTVVSVNRKYRKLRQTTVHENPT